MIKLSETTTVHFGLELNRVRKDAKHMWASLAAATTYSQYQLRNWSSGDQRPPRGHVIRAIAAACGVSPVSLYLAAAKDTGELSIDTTGLTVQEMKELLHLIAEAIC